MRKSALTILAFGLAIVAAELLSVSGAHAAKWTVCNRSPNNVDVAIAWQTSNGFISRGWWNIRACGGCAVVFNRPLEASIVFLRGEAAGGIEYSGNSLLCIRRTAFEMPRANTSRQACLRRGGQFASFGQHNIRTQNHTTNLQRPAGPGPVCID